VEARFFTHVQTGPGAHPVSCTMGTGSFPGVNQLGMVLTTNPLLAPMSRISTAVPLLPLWTFRACYTANFNFTKGLEILKHEEVQFLIIFHIAIPINKHLPHRLPIHFHPPLQRQGLTFWHRNLAFKFQYTCM
jgi:hypothetical protein